MLSQAEDKQFGDSHMTNDTGLRDSYISLLRDIIINRIYSDQALRPSKSWKFWTKSAEVRDFDQNKRESGLDWPSVAHSMIGAKRMDNLRFTLCDVLEKGVQGDFVETGVWRGGACIFARGIMKAYGDTDRTVWVADSFAGLPKPNAEKYAADAGDKHYQNELLAVTMEQVKENFRCYDLLDEQVKFLKGWFSETLPDAPIEKVAVLRLDGDMYESTMDAMQALYHKVSSGGYVIVDDYHAVEGCRLAVHDYLNEHAPDEKPEIKEIDGVGVYWQRNL